MKKTLLLFISILSLNITFSQDEIIEIQEEREVSEVFTIVEEMPIFSEECVNENLEKQRECTKKAIQKYTATINYPQVAIDNDIQGKVYVSFTIDKDGDIINVELLRGVDPLLDNASLEHIKNMPKFYKPGYQRGKAVKVKYNIPINFKLDNSGSKVLTKKELRKLRKLRKKLQKKKKKS